MSETEIQWKENMSMKGKTSKHFRITSTVDGKYKVLYRVQLWLHSTGTDHAVCDPSTVEDWQCCDNKYRQMCILVWIFSIESSCKEETGDMLLNKKKSTSLVTLWMADISGFTDCIPAGLGHRIQMFMYGISMDRWLPTLILSTNSYGYPTFSLLSYDTIYTTLCM